MADKITMNTAGELQVTDKPIIPFFEAAHGTAPKYAGQDKVNPGSELLSGDLRFEYLDRTDAADDVIRALEATVTDKVVIYDFARQMEGATEVKCSEFGSAIVDRL